MKSLNLITTKSILLLFGLQIFFYFTAKAQPKERLKNRYREDNMSYGAPYTMFDIAKYGNAKSSGVTQRINELIEQIKNPDKDSLYFRLFKSYYSNPNPAPLSKVDRDYDPLAAHAKNKAFIALVGVDGSGNPLPQSEITRLQNEAYSALENMNTDVLNLIRFHSAGLNAGQLLLFRTRELVQYLQAYDMLKASGRIANYANDKNGVMQNPRNRLREFTRNIYDVGMGLWGPARWGDNHTLGFAAAIGLASVVLNDAGAANLRFKYRPDRWAEKAHKFLNKAMWEGYWYGPPRLAVEGQISGYAEGPSYYEYFMLGTGMPYLRALHNLVPGNGSRDYLYTQKWKDLFKWRNELTTASGFFFGFDNSYYDNQNSLLLSGMPEYTYLPPNASPNVGQFLHADLLALHPTINTNDTRKGVVSMPDAGQTIMRMKNGDDNHYFMLLHEQGTPVGESGHEDDDMGSIQLGVNNYMLVFDPPYLGWKNAYRTNNFSHHNTVLFLGANGDKVSSDNILNYTTTLEASEGLRTPSGILYNEIKSNFVNTNSGNATRFIRMINDFGYVYYLIDDVINSNGFAEKVSIQINGNGSSSDTTSSYGIVGGTSYWTHPCSDINLQSGWSLASISAAVNGNNYPLTIENNDANTTHNTGGGHLTETRNEIGGHSNGYNSRIRISQNQQIAEIKTILLPYKCNNTPRLTKSETSNSASITVHFPEGSTVHLSKTGSNDTTDITNPFDSTTGKVLSSNANRVALSMANDSVFKTKNYCESHTYFRKAAIENGTYLAYDSVTYINSLTSAKFSAYYELTAKYKYQGNTHVYDSTGFVIAQFYLPEVDSGFAMIARGENVDSSAYNMVTKILTVKLTEGKSDLLIELANPCQLSCFFPPDTVNIDSVFYFSTGTTEILSHDLQVRTNEGLLLITNKSEMSICSNAILYNKDSIILWSSATGKRKQPNVCTTGYGTNDVKEARSSINVNEGATLILLPSSVTHIKEGGQIYVAKGGTLIVKSGAQLIIGGSSKLGFGELFLDRGANLCVEPGASVRFYKDINDTSDKNLFWVYHSNGSGYNPTVVGVNSGSSNYYRLVDSTFITTTNTCTQLCDFATVFPLNGIEEREWGFFSSAKPLARFILNSTYICPNDSVIIDTKQVLNEVGWEYEVCELDPIDSTVITNSCFKQGNISTGGDNCVEYNYLPSRINLSAIYSFEEEHLYKIKMKVINGCNVEHDTSQIIYILTKPKLYFNYANEICEGNTLTADTFYSNVINGNIKHIWSVDLLRELLEEDSLSLNEENLNYEGHIWEFDSTVNSQFNFPGFHFTGGNNYLITLEIESPCGVIEYADTVSVPFGVSVTADRLVSFSNPIGENGIQLIGSTTLTYDSIRWSPTNKLVNYTGLNPTTTTMDSTIYILQAFKDNCSASDSILIKHRQLVNLGNDTTICYEGSVLLGNSLDGLVMLGLLIYLDESTYSNVYTDIDASYPDAAKKLALFLYQDNYSFYNDLNTSSSGAFISLIKLMHNKMRSTTDYAGALTLYKYQPLSDVIAYFRDNYWPSNTRLTAEIDSFVDTFGGLSSYLGAINGGLAPYFNFFDNNNGAINVTSEWYKNDTLLSGEDDWLSIYEQNLYSPTKYGLVIDNGSIVEYDEIFVTLDSAFSPFYIPAYSIDSTVYFNPYPSSPAHLKYYWNFGDGDTSTSKNPIHTFNKFNKSYYVCLTVSNMCNSYTSCDTLLVDTTLNYQFILGKKETSTLPIVKQPDEKLNNSTRSINEVMFLGNNIPNPFGTSTEIEYEINEQAIGAVQFTITNTLGQNVLTLPIKKAKGKIIINKDQLGSGIYYYYLNINGLMSGGKIMIVK